MKTTTITLAIMFVSLNIYLGFPIFGYIENGDFQLPVPVLFPFTDLESRKGFIINVLNQTIICLIGCSGNIGIEVIQSILKNTVWASTVAIVYSIDEFSANFTKSTSTPLRDRYFRNIVRQVQDLDRYVPLWAIFKSIAVVAHNLVLFLWSYISKLSHLFYWKFFVQPIMLIFAISLSFFFGLYVSVDFYVNLVKLTIFTTLPGQGIWTPGYGLAFFSYSQLYILCDIGDEIDSAVTHSMHCFLNEWFKNLIHFHQNKKLVLALHGMPWYLMERTNNFVMLICSIVCRIIVSSKSVHFLSSTLKHSQM